MFIIPEIHHQSHFKKKSPRSEKKAGLSMTMGKQLQKVSISMLMILALLFLLVFHTNAAEHGCISSCGSQEITSPFRLQDDPKTCGRPETEFQLTCDQSNRLVANLSSRPYCIKEISYKGQTIRAVDSALRSNDCSSLPPYPPYRGISNLYVKRYADENTIVFVNCSLAVDSPNLIPTAPCIRGPPGIHLYAMMSGGKVQDLNTSCTVAMKVHVSIVGGPGISYPPTVYSQVHDLMMMGFELGWTGECRDTVDCWGEYRMCDDDHFIYVWRSCSTCKGHFQSFHCFVETVKLYLKIIFYYTFYKKNNIVIGKTSFLYIEIYFLGRIAIGIVCLSIFLAYKLKRKHIWMDTTVGEFLSKYNYQMPRRYSYSDIKKMTQNFKEKLGQGGYGSVFKGKHSSGRLVAVKMLKMSNGDGREFINEVATVGRIYHINVVPLNGFCSEGSKRALIYNFMPNGSLEKYIFNKGEGSPLSWDKLYKIALGAARGIQYLHHGCDMRILHFDIKPHNILLDEDFTPKVSDFGLAKFYPATQGSMVSVTAVRGTIGYIAPELIYKTFGNVSYESDVYSFGMLLMEMAGKRKKIDASRECSSVIYYPLWIYDQLDQGMNVLAEDDTDGDKEIAKKLIIVSLWCIQMNPKDRPSMSKVVEMLEANLEDLRLPAKDLLSFPQEILEIDCTTSTELAESSTSQSFIDSNTLKLNVV